MDHIMITEEQIQNRIVELADKINLDYQDLNTEKPVLVIGMLTGAFTFTADLVRHLNFHISVDFISASSYGASTVSTGSVVIKKDVGDITGRHILLVEDIIDSGISMKHILALLGTRNPASIRLCALLSKPDRRVTPIKIDYLGFTIKDEFVVGYGLDFAGRYRALPYIGVLKPELYN
ncbi:MAG: hypoxanthine phosphoribosyltransferase [Clostridiales bacterium]|nr:hypoxanthine phosphoribosyltransferase [Clostridiales bacterium]